MPLSKQTLPELDLNAYQSGTMAQKTEFSLALKNSLIEFGFVIIKNQNIVSPEILSDAYSVLEDFYALPSAVKRQYTKQGGQVGYTAFGTENAKGNTVPDLKEFWHIGQMDVPSGAQAKDYQNNIWPNFQGFQDIFTSLYQGLESMGLLILQALASQIDPGSTYLQDMPRQGKSVLRLLHYPPLRQNDPVNALRAAAHEDINLITLLVAANGKGLQLLTRDGQWMEVETSPSNIIIDAGDMLAYITGQKIPATTHRVINTGDLSKSRYSIPFFMHPRPGCILRPLEKFCDRPDTITPITARDSLAKRLREIGLT